MKYVVVLILVIIGALAYVRFEQPQDWNKYLGILLTALKAPEETSPISPAPTNSLAAAASNSDSTSPDSSSATTVPAPGTTTEVISPDSSNYINPDHVRPVEQPTQPSIPSNTPVTNAAAVGPKVFIPPDPLPAQPNWTWTVLGKDYHNVVVTKVEADVVHIIYDGGIGSLNQADLPPDLQKIFGYDPAEAESAAKAKADSLAIADRDEMTKAQQQAQIAAQTSPPPSSAPQTAQAHVGLSSEQRATIQSQIQSLQADISFMQAEEAKTVQEGNKQVVKADNRGATQGAYADKIASEQAQVAQLQAELK